MRLLICTQAVDRNDPFLGFFHQWIEELAHRCESVHVICLKEGEHQLPKNVLVHSLGKEKSKEKYKGRSFIFRMVARGLYVARFYWYIWALRDEYDAVLVHMNQEYVLLGAPLWRIRGKRVFMWRNHYAGSIFTNLAVALCDKVFCTSKHSYTARFKKTVLMPVGVDTARFRPDASGSRTPHSILFLGRIAPSKRPDMLIEALGILKQRGIAFTATVCGPTAPEDVAFARALRKRTEELGLADVIIFKDGIAHDATPALYAAHELYVNLSLSGMYDKTLFEAAASGCLVVSRSDDFNAHTDPCLALAGDTPTDLARHIESLLVLSPRECDEMSQGLQRFAAANGMHILSRRLVEEMHI